MGLCLDTSVTSQPFASADVVGKPFALAHISPCQSIGSSRNQATMFTIFPAPRNSAQKLKLVLTTDDPDADLTADTVTLEFFDKSMGGPHPLFSKSSGVGIISASTSTAQRLEATATILPSDWTAVETGGLSFGEREISVLVNLWVTRDGQKSLITSGQFKSLPNAEEIPAP